MLQDVRVALRLLRRAPVSTAIALLSIALSVGATAVVFAAIKSVLLDPLPYARPGELVQLRSEYPRMQKQSQGDWLVANDTRELVRRTRTLRSLGVYHNAVFDLAGTSNATPQALYGLLVNASLFPTLGVSPMLGRNVLLEEDQPNHADVMILSYGLWARRFHSDPSVVGRTVTINGHGCRVIGVMPPNFNFPLRREAAHTPSPYVEFWAAPSRLSPNPDAGVGSVARLRPGVSLAEARQDLASISGALAHDFPATNRDRILTLNPLRERAIGPAAESLWLLMAAAVLFMLIGCANVANLLLARGLGRQREMAVRLAMGAGSGRIVRQLLTESCVLAVLGGLGGFLLTAAAWRVLPAMAPVSIPRLAAARADSTLFAFALGMAMLNGILFGLAPALRIAGLNRAQIWSGFGSRGASAGRRDRVRSWLVAAEVALSVLLVVTGAQVLGSFVRLMATDPGFQENGVLASVVLPAPERYRDPERRGLFYQRILNAVRALPDVESVGTTDALPFSGENHGGFVSAGGISDPRPLTAEIVSIGARHSYFGKDEWEAFAPGLKTIGDAVKIREQILISFERAERLDSISEAAKYLNFVVIGGGPTGVEMAGAIAEIAYKTMFKNFRRINPAESKIYLVEALPGILPMYPEKLSKSATQTLEKMGVKVLTGKKVTNISEKGVQIDGMLIESMNIIWAAGNQVSPMLKTLGVPLDRAGRVLVQPDMSIPNYPDIFVIGDAAHLDTKEGKPLPGVAPVAMQQGRYVAKIIKKEIPAEHRSPFVYFDKGSMATIGKAKAIAMVGKLQLSGFLAWLMWAFVHIMFLIGFRNRLSVMLEWGATMFTGERGVRLINRPIDGEPPPNHKNDII